MYSVEMYAAARLFVFVEGKSRRKAAEFFGLHRDTISKDGKRMRAFSELISHYLFKDRFGRLGKGNDKGKVKNLVKNGRRRCQPLTASRA